MVLLNSLNEALLVSFGAIFGANTRYIIYKKLEKIHLNKGFIILVINIFATFFLGVSFATFSQNSFSNFSYQIGLFFSIGFLGSLSTFSTFIYDLFDLCRQLKFYKAFKMFLLSLVLGMFFLTLGFLLGS